MQCYISINIALYWNNRLAIDWEINPSFVEGVNGELHRDHNSICHLIRNGFALLPELGANMIGKRENVTSIDSRGYDSRER